MKQRLLIVDDEPGIVDMTSKIFKASFMLSQKI